MGRPVALADRSGLVGLLNILKPPPTRKVSDAGLVGTHRNMGSTPTSDRAISLVFRNAEQPELLRAWQKDEAFCHTLQSEFSEICSRLFGESRGMRMRGDPLCLTVSLSGTRFLTLPLSGARFVTLYQKELRTLAGVLFFGLTTGLGHATV